MTQQRQTVQVELRDARPAMADREWLTNVYPFYLHDLSEFDDGYYHLTDRGLWEPDHLPSWLADDNDHPLLILANGRRIGFALVNQAPSPHMMPGMDYRMSEFFILRGWRRSNLGRRAALAVFKRFPGMWELSELPRNTGATAFWRRIIGEYTGGTFDEAITNGAVRQVFRSK